MLTWVCQMILGALLHVSALRKGISVQLERMFETTSSLTQCYLFLSFIYGTQHQVNFSFVV